MWNKIYFILSFLLSLLLNCLNNKIIFTDPNYYWFEIEFQNIKRKNIIYFPNDYLKINLFLNEKTTTLPLIISLHGGGGEIDSNLKLSKGKLLELKEKYKFFLLLPEGYKNHWNDGRNYDKNISSINDVEYLKNLIKYTIENFPINRDKIYIFGISNGGMMSFRFACESPEWIDGFATIAATMPKNLLNDCNPYKKLKIMMIHGTKDPFVPYEGGQVKILFKERGEVLSFEKTLDFWVSKNKCSTEKVEKEILKSPLEKTYTEIQKFNCKEKKIIVYKVLNGGHTWPGGLSYLPEWYIGKTTKVFSAEEEIIEFFLKENE